jgi:hypothetical protein
MGLFDAFCNMVAGAGSAAHDHANRDQHKPGFFGAATFSANEAARWNKQGDTNQASWWAGRAGESHRRRWF